MSAVELVPGAVIGERYRLERRLGEGGMGVVWAATELASGELHALKLLKEAPASGAVGSAAGSAGVAEALGAAGSGGAGGAGGEGNDDALDARRRFANEARAAQAVRHRHVVRIHGVIEDATGRPAIAMELLEGQTLRELLAARGRLPLREAAALLAPVIAAVGAAHRLGVVHRDLKPENLFLARGDADDAAESGGGAVVKILDFGIAKVTALDGETMRTTGMSTGKVLGTPAYMAPEQVYGQTDLDHRVDIWALGIVAYQTLSGVLPTAGDNLGQVFRNVTARPFPPLEELVPELPPVLGQLIGRMLARERGERPADLREVFAGFAQVAASSAGEAAALEALTFGAPAARLLRAAARADEQTAAGAGSSLRAAGTAPHPATAAALGALDALERRPAAAGRSRHPPPRLGRRLASFALVAIAATVALVSYLGSGSRISSPPSPAASPLAGADAILACPILRASGVAEPAGWLGAAAAATACERARLLLGGRPERTLAPAELLELPAAPSSAFPEDPFGSADARERSLTTARRRAAAYLDGEVTSSSAGFAVTLTLHRADGAELFRATGRGRGLVEAVRAAMDPLVRPAVLPRAAALEPPIAAWARTADVDIALASLDLTFSFAHNAGGLADECRRFAALGERPGELGVEGRWLCAYVLGRPAPPVELPRSDGSPAAVATALRIEYLLRRTAPPDAAAQLRRFFAAEPTPRGRSMLAASESCVIGAADPRAARELAFVAVQAEPKNPEGGWCNPWEQLMTLERDTPGAGAAQRAMQAWVPWNSYAWLEAGFGAASRHAEALPMLRRAYALSPFDAQIAGTLAGAYLAAGDRVAARGLALALRSGGLPLHQVESDLLLVRIESSEARFAAALARAEAGSVFSADDAGWVRAQRFEMAWRALELAALLGRGRPVADALIAGFLTPEPSRLDGHFAAVPMRVPAICASSSQPAPCFARFRALRQALPGAITADTDAFLLGAERYASGDLRGAAEAWRPLLAGGMALALSWPDAIAETFARTGAPELAERLDAEEMKRASEYHGATVAHLRAARRAAARGDRAGARALCEAVVEAWAIADEPPPALAEARRLLASLEGR